MQWEANCANPSCSKPLRRGGGVFCANFAFERGTYPACQQAWCGNCYVPLPSDRFPIRRMGGEVGEGDLVTSLEDPHRYLRATDGAHFVVPFQCDRCWFRNLQGRDPMPNSAKDAMLRVCIRRVNLDAIWAREPSTYRSTLATLRRDYDAAYDLVGLREPVPKRGPFPLADPFGMTASVMVLLSSLRQGRRGQHIQWDTARTTTSAYSNAWMSGLDTLGATVAAREDRKLMITSCPTRADFCERFQRGCKLRMGSEKKQNYGLSSAQVLDLTVEMEGQWQAAASDERRRTEIEDVAVFMLVSFLAGLRGEEVPLLSLEGMLKH